MHEVWAQFIGGGVSELTLIGNNTAGPTTGAMSPHADTVAGDLLVLVDAAVDASATNTGTPSGWSAAFSFSEPTNAFARCHLALATSGIIASGVTPIQTVSALTGGARLYTFRPDEEITGFTFSANPRFSSSMGTSGTIQHVVDASLAPEPFIVFSLFYVRGLLIPSSSPAFDTETSGGVVDFKHRLNNTGPADHTITGTLNGGSTQKIMASTWVSVF